MTIQTTIARHVASTALERAQADSAAEANAWPNTRLAQFTLSLLDDAERKADTLAGIEAYDGEDKRDVELPIADMIHGLRVALAQFRAAAIDDVAAGWDDEAFADDLFLRTLSVEDAIKAFRARARLSDTEIG